jgi:hypothetical protein
MTKLLHVTTKSFTPNTSSIINIDTNSTSTSINSVNNDSVNHQYQLMTTNNKDSIESKINFGPKMPQLDKNIEAWRLNLLHKVEKYFGSGYR